MKTPLPFMAILPLVASLMGCASTGGYLVDRGRDFADIITVSAEIQTVGVTAQVGPLLAGASYGDGKGFGLRSGSMGAYEFAEVSYLLGGRKQFIGNDEREGKAYDLESRLLAFPLEVLGYAFVMAPFSYLDDEPSWSVNELWRDNPPLCLEEGGWQTYFHCEASAALFGGIRAGFNPAEILDFILGWTTLDICGDDITAKKQKEKLNKTGGR